MYKMGNARQLTMEICTNGAITLPHDYLCYVAINTKLKACVMFSSKVMFSVLLVYCLCNRIWARPKVRPWVQIRVRVFRVVMVRNRIKVSSCLQLVGSRLWTRFCVPTPYLS